MANWFSIGKKNNRKKKGVIALEASMALLLTAMASYGVAATSAIEFSQMAASQDAKQAEQYAALEAEHIKMAGYSGFTAHARQSMSGIAGAAGNSWQSKVSLANTISTGSHNIRVARVDVFKSGDGDIPRFSLEVPLSSYVENQFAQNGNGPGQSLVLKYENTDANAKATAGKTFYAYLGGTKIPINPDLGNTYVLNGNSPGESIKISHRTKSDGTDEIYATWNGKEIPLNSSKTDVPVGTIIPFVGSTLPSWADNGTWAICNGQSFSKIQCPELAQLLPSGKLPDLRGMFLEGGPTAAGSTGTTTYNVGSTIPAGLPNIKGEFGASVEESGAKATGPFYLQDYGPGADDGLYNYRVGFDASLANPIYGNSLVVQPNAYVVNYLIRLK